MEEFKRNVEENDGKKKKANPRQQDDPVILNSWGKRKIVPNSGSSK